MYDIDPRSWHAQPWRNGRGTTHQILRHPDRDDYALRLSVAEVTRSGPFSRFAGYRRWTMLVDGGPIELAGARLASIGDVVELDGDEPVAATVIRGAKLVNVLARAELALRVGYGPTPRSLTIALAVCDGGVLDRWHTRVFDQPTAFDARCCAWVDTRAGLSAP
ncbi:MAG: HutD family protein [Kofleriaceae bacterium]